MKKHAQKAAVWAVLAMSGLGTTALTACWEPTPDINRVQPNYVSKSIFTGEWYTRATVVDKQYETFSVFAGVEGGLERIRWEIEPNVLVGYRSYDRAPGTDLSNPGAQTPIVIFSIEKHFDIKRAYNPVNGVESNVIEENTDKPWYEREYIRVDWSRNLVSNYDLNTLSATSPAVVRRDSNNDPSYPWKLRISDDYIETTIDTILQPEPEACFFMNDFNCGGADAKVKISFMKMTGRDPYEKLNYPDFAPVKFGFRTNPVTQQQELCFEGDADCQLQELWTVDGPFGTEFCDLSIHDPDSCFQFTIPMFSKFGFFRTDRYVYDRENGYTQTGRERLINRWNLWQNSFDAAGNPLPHSQRTPKPVVYHLNPLFPEDLIPAVQAMADDWDVAFRNTVAELQGKNPNDVPRMYEVRRNSCNIEAVKSFAAEHDLEDELAANGISNVAYGNLEEACAVLEYYTVGSETPFTWEQLGDLRYSFANWINKAELAGPLGFGPSASDPITGEIISANANIYGASLDTYANWGADIVELLNGTLSEEDVINGTQIREHVEKVRNRAKKDQKMSAEDVNRFMRLVNERTGHMSDDRYLIEKPLTAVNENLDRLAATGFEDEYLVTGDMVRLFSGKQSVLSDPQASEKALNAAKPSQWGRSSIPSQFMMNINDDQHAPHLDPKMMQGVNLAEAKSDYFGRQNFCYMAEQVEPAIADLAVALQGKTREEAVHFIRANVFRAVMAHEVGHTLGLRHNFEGSADALNFFPQYWGVDTGDHRMGSGNTSKDEVQYSSIMDYHQRFNSDFGGIGLYDKAAIKFGYGQLVEVFDESRESFVPRSWKDSLFLFNFSDYPYLFGGADTDDRINSLYDGVITQLLGGDDTVFMDVKNIGILPKPENLYERKDITFESYKRQRVQDIFGQNNDQGLATEVAVPYAYCSDAYAAGGNLTCNRYDKGTTSEEIVANAVEMYEFYYPFDAFRRDRMITDGDSWANGYMGRLYSRTYQPMLNAFRYFYYYRRSTAQMWPLIRDWSAASFQGFNFFARVLQTPEPGQYCLVNNEYIPAAEAANCNSPIDIGLGDGRYFDTNWSREFEFRPNNVGHLYDKLLAIQSLTDSNAFFFRDFSNLLNRSAFSIGYYRVFQPEVIKLFGGLIRGDRSAYSARVINNGGTPTLEYQPIVSLDYYQVGGNNLPGNPDGIPIRPTDSFAMRYYAIFFGMANLTSNVDQTMDFSRRARISLVGSRNDPVYADGVPQSIFTDPTTLLSYRAAAVDGVDLSLSYQIIDEAQQYVTTGEWGQAKASLDAARVAGDEDAIADAELNLAIATQELNQKVQIIDMLRQLGDALEYSQ